MGPSNTVPLSLARMIMEKPEATLMKTIFIQNWRIVPENTAEPFWGVNEVCDMVNENWEFLVNTCEKTYHQESGIDVEWIQTK